MMLAPDVTIANIAELLEDPEEYVRRALGNLRAATAEEPQAVITIGITGKGTYPNYKIDRRRVEELWPGANLNFVDTARVYSGRTHQLLVDPDTVREEHWSTQSMGFNDLRSLLGEIRKLRR